MAAATIDRADPAARAFAPARARRVIGGGAALAFSLGAHALMAAIAGVTLYSLGARERPPAAGVEIEIAAAPAPVVLDTPVPVAPQSSPPPPARKPAHRIEAARPTTAKPPSAAAPPPTLSPALVAASAPTIPQAPSPPVRFAMSAGTVAGRAGGSAPAPSSSAAATSAGAGGAGAEPVLDAAAVDQPATLLSHPPAVYPPVARRAEVEGDVTLEIVVDANGVVSRASVLSDHGYGLDAAALQAVRAYRFSPARRAGRPVRVRMRWSVQFRLR
jgi:protein TonB